jgi:hypothetical protein
VPVSRAVVADPIPDVPAITEPHRVAERLGGISMRLDISVWRLPHLWRLVVFGCGATAKPLNCSSAGKNVGLPAHQLLWSSNADSVRLSRSDQSLTRGVTPICSIMKRIMYSKETRGLGMCARSK